jgi:hypothetical protein
MQNLENMSVTPMSEGPRFHFGTAGKLRQRTFAFAVMGRISQLGRSPSAPTVGLSKIGCFNDQIIFEIICVHLYYRRRGDGGKKKVGDSGSRFPFWEFWH